MKYKIIFTSGYVDDSDSLMKGYKSDILLLDQENKYYQLNFIEIDVIRNKFDKSKLCFLESNMVILHQITKDSILKCIAELHNWQFYKRWLPLKSNELEIFYPKEDWDVFEVEI